MKGPIVLCMAATVAACTNHAAKSDGDSGSSSRPDEAPHPGPGKYEVMVSHDATGLSAASGSFQPAGSVCVSADQAANPRRLIFGERAYCDDRHSYFQSGSISADLRCAAAGGDVKNVPVNVYGVYKRDYWRVTEEVRLFGKTQREERIYRRTGDC